jgi:hypothetical protein
LIVQALQTSPAAAFVALAVTGGMALPLTVTLGRQLRQEQLAFGSPLPALVASEVDDPQ